MVKDKNIEVFLLLVKAGLFLVQTEGKSKIRIDGTTNWQEVYRLATEQSVLGLVLAGIERFKIRKTVLILACSLGAKRNSLFKPEYILPQCVLHSLIHRSYYNHSLLCIRFYSSHLLNGDADYFRCDYSNKDFLPRYVNYVFPPYLRNVKAIV